MTYAPFFLKLNDTSRTTIVGGGAVAMAKAETMLGFGAEVRVVSERILPELQALLRQGNASFLEARYEARHLQGARIVIAATDDPALNAQIHADAKALGAWVNVVDKPDLCDFIFPATIKRGDIQIAISTAGSSPLLARLLKRRIEQMLPWNLERLGDWLREKRSLVAKSFRHMQVRRQFWDRVLEGPIAQEVLEGNDAKAEVLLAQALVEHENAPRAALYLIGAGPGHPDLITVRAVQLLWQADVVLYDHLIPPDTLTRYARREAHKLPVGKRADDHSRTQGEITGLIEQHLRANKIVVRLKGGDPGIYAHAAEEIEVAQKLGVPCQIVPGITAALGCAATAGIPLTERGGASGVRFLTLYDETLHDENFWQSLALSASDTLVFYMSTSRRAWLFQKLLSLGFKTDLPVLLIEQGTTPLHAEYEATLGTFDALYSGHSFITPALLIVGDVVRWRARHGWKEPTAERRAFFQKEAHHAH
jgi:uroporphyrin-III C-methyltransferase/precorrin-2 dehydrogenase/sirohydrochlorin ferrochelatase